MRHGQRRFYDGAIQIPAAKSGDVAVEHAIQPPGTTLHSGNVRTAYFGQKSEAITFDGETRWHKLVEESYGLWMTDYPIEQRQMDDLVSRARGKVLVGGLGLGYAVVALATRRRVKEIVVVERSPDIIKLVWNATADRVAHWCREFKIPMPRISIVQSDLFKYLRTRQVGPASRVTLPPPVFDWALYDIWQSDGEHTFHDVVIPLRRLSEGVVRKVECWNEGIMRAQMFQHLHTRLLLIRAPKETGIRELVSLDVLCAEQGNSYADWAVPFWQWYRDHGKVLGEKMLHRMAGHYVGTYGLASTLPDVFEVA